MDVGLVHGERRLLFASQERIRLQTALTEGLTEIVGLANQVRAKCFFFFFFFFFACLMRDAGWLLPSITLVVMTVLTSYSATLLCEAMVLVPGNDRLQKRIEFSTVVGPLDFCVFWFSPIFA